jgi:hypothetical protein
MRGAVFLSTLVIILGGVMIWAGYTNKSAELLDALT